MISPSLARVKAVRIRRLSSSDQSLFPAHASCNRMTFDIGDTGPEASFDESQWLEPTQCLNQLESRQNMQLGDMNQPSCLQSLNVEAGPPSAS